MKNKIKDLLALFALMLFYTIGMNKVLAFLLNPLQIRELFHPILPSFYAPNPLPQFVSACVLAPFLEEAFFRYMPMEIVKACNNKKLIFPVMILSSFIFGLAHGSILNILLQGAGGFLLCYLYLKYNSYLLNVFSHALWNFSVIYLISF